MTADYKTMTTSQILERNAEIGRRLDECKTVVETRGSFLPFGLTTILVRERKLVRAELERRRALSEAYDVER